MLSGLTILLEGVSGESFSAPFPKAIVTRESVTKDCSNPGSQTCKVPGMAGYFLESRSCWLSHHLLHHGALLCAQHILDPADYAICQPSNTLFCTAEPPTVAAHNATPALGPGCILDLPAKNRPSPLDAMRKNQTTATATVA